MSSQRKLFTILILKSILELSSNQNQSPALFLTPYIDSNRIAEAKSLSKVRNLSSVVQSYCGLITVDKKNGAHTFFWFFPAAENPEKAPVLLWFSGGPGDSSIPSLLLAHGPFSLDADGNLELREITWTKNHSVIYIDQPMDVGYSFTEKEAGYITSCTAVAPNVYNFLVQFFKLFPEFKRNDFYTSGVSFGGIYAPATAHYIHMKNQENPEIKINLKGMFIETPLIDPISQVDYGEYLYHFGLIDEHGLEFFKNQSSQIKSLITQERYLEAVLLKESVFDGSNTTYFTNVTGFSSFSNILLDRRIPRPLSIAEPKFRKFLHVGDLRFTGLSQTVVNAFKPNIFRSAKSLVEDLLNWGYKTLIYSGQLDIITYHLGIDQMIKNLKWDESEQYAKAQRKLWTVNGTVAGYSKTVKHFTYVLVRNAGHASSAQQPAWIFDLLNKFTQGTPF